MTMIIILDVLSGNCVSPLSREKFANSIDPEEARESI